MNLPDQLPQPKVDQQLTAPGTWVETPEAGIVQATNYEPATLHFADGPLSRPLLNNPYVKLVNGVEETNVAPADPNGAEVSQVGAASPWEHAGTGQVFGKNRTVFERQVPEGTQSVVLTDQQRVKFAELNPNSPFAPLGHEVLQAMEIPNPNAVPAPIGPTPPTMKG